MKRNINLMQPNEELDSNIFNDAQKEYILQALANLGQRIGIKGDGLGYRSFSFFDLLGNDTLTYSSNKYIGYLEYNKDNENDQYVATFGLHDIKLDEDKILENITTKSINNILYFDKEFSFTIPVNGIEKYAKGSIISNVDNVLTIITVGKIIGYNDDDELNSALLYYKFDTLTNKIIYAAKVYHIFQDNKSDYFVLLRLTENTEKRTTKYSNIYNLNIRIFNANVLSDNYKKSFKDLFCFINYNDPSLLSFNFLRSDFLDVETLEGTTIYNEFNSLNFDYNSPISIILNNESKTNLYNDVDLELSFDSYQNEFISISDNFEEIVALYKNEYSFSNLEEHIYEFNADITELYRNMFLLYNDKFYIESKEQLFKRILCKLYEELNGTERIGRLYVPLNYTINYICNSNDELNVYYSTDIYVLLSNINEKNDKSMYLGNSKYIIYDYSGIDTVKSYKFEVTYNSYYEDIINDVSIKLIYTMPYVNDEENWNINGENTNIRAVGRDAGNPNIIIIYSKDKNNDSDSYYVINAIKDKEVIAKSGFIRNKFKIDSKLFTNLNNQTINCYGYVPIIDNDNKSVFENSIIINICDLNCLENESYIEYYIGSNIITIWYYGKTDNEFKFNLVTEADSDCALPLGATTNIASILGKSSLSSISADDIIILKAKLSKLAHESLNNVSLNWEIIKNKTATEFNNDSNLLNEEYKYYNNLNAVIEYTDNLVINESTVQYNQNEKYLPDVNALDTTNILYPKFKIVTNSIEAPIETIVQTIEATLVNEEIISININNNGDVVFSDEIRQTLRDQLVNSTETTTATVTYKTIEYESAENYNEYLFNSNVPTLDLKEIFVRNSNTLNRLNVISLDNEGKSYYAYLGTSYDESNKSTFHIGSINKNINIGSDTLIDEVNRENFNTHSKVSVDFDNIYMNPKYKLSSHKPQVVEFKDDYISNSNKYGMGTEWLTDKLFMDIEQISQTDLNKLHENTVLKQDVENPILNINETTRVGAVAFYNESSKPFDLFDQSHAPNIRRLDYSDDENYFQRFGVCINTIMNHMFNVDISKYDNIRIFHGGNKMIIWGKFQDQNRTVLEEEIPYFFILLNDNIACEHNNVLMTSETLDVSYETYTLGKRINQDGTTTPKTNIDIYVEFGKNNKQGFNYVSCQELVLYVSSGGTYADIDIDPTIAVTPFYWYCGTTPITDDDIYRYNQRGSIDNIITSQEDHDEGWRILSTSARTGNWWEGDDLYNYIVFPIDWQRFDDDAHYYHLIIPEGLHVEDYGVGEGSGGGNVVPFDTIYEHVLILNKYYNVYKSRAPWYEFTYKITGEYTPRND